jgi:hypothetical protein
VTFTLLAGLALAEPAVWIDCSELGSSLGLIGRGGVHVPADDKGEPVGVPQGSWTLRFLTEDVGRLEVRPDTVLLSYFEDRGTRNALRLAEWPAADLGEKLCKRLKKGDLAPPSKVLVSWRLSG